MPDVPRHLRVVSADPAAPPREGHGGTEQRQADRIVEGMDVRVDPDVDRR